MGLAHVHEGRDGALEWDVFVPDPDIQSTVSNGWVTLTGMVETVSERDDAARAVRNLTGVRGVDNQITVRQPWWRPTGSVRPSRKRSNGARSVRPGAST